MSDREFERAVADWLDDGTDRTPEPAIDGVLLAVRTTPQERDLRIPWRLPAMLAQPRATGIAAVALVAVVGVGGLIFLNSRASSGVGTTPTPAATPADATPTATSSVSPTASPTASPTPATSQVAPGITGWIPFTSPAYNRGWSYPEDWQASAATRAWGPGDTTASAEAASDIFVSPDNEIGVAVWQVPVGDAAGLDTVDGLEVWAEQYCIDSSGPNCDTLRSRAESLCLSAGGDSCRPAILVRSEGGDPADAAEYAFFPDWTSLVFTNAPDKVTVMMTGRGDTYPAAVPYVDRDRAADRPVDAGGAVRLLESFLSQVGVTPR